MALSKELNLKLESLRQRHEEINLRLTELKKMNQLLKKRQEDIYLKFAWVKY